MAPSATSDIVVPQVSETKVGAQPEKHVHGAEDKTPLEAISHGPLIHPGMQMSKVFPVFCFRLLLYAFGFLQNPGDWAPSLPRYIGSFIHLK